MKKALLVVGLWLMLTAGAMAESLQVSFLPIAQHVTGQRLTIAAGGQELIVMLNPQTTFEMEYGGTVLAFSNPDKTIKIALLCFRVNRKPSSWLLMRWKPKNETVGYNVKASDIQRAINRFGLE